MIRQHNNTATDYLPIFLLMNADADKKDSLKQCDLHIHSVFSDSDATIEEIFRTAKDKGLLAVAITDHDTIDGLDEARKISISSGVETG